MLHFTDNHDVASDNGEDRIEKVIGTAGVDALLILDFMLDGVPFVFNGYEVADELKHNMFPTDSLAEIRQSTGRTSSVRKVRSGMHC